MENEYFELVKSQRESQKKFDYFFLAVILSVLSLSINSFNINDYENCYFLIVFAWVSLLISFLSGMSRQEKINIALFNEAEELWAHDELKGFEKMLNSSIEILKSTGEVWTSEELQKEKDKFKKMLRLAAKNISNSDKYALKAYNIQKWTFVLSLILISIFKMINI